MDTENPQVYEGEPEHVPDGTPDDVNDGALEVGPPDEDLPKHTEERIAQVQEGGSK